MGLIDGFVGTDMDDDDTIEVFIYESREWVLTGRTATRPVFHARYANRKIGTMTMVEIQPTNSMISDPSLHRWVDPRELYYVETFDPSEIDIDMLKESNIEAISESGSGN